MKAKSIKNYFFIMLVIVFFLCPYSTEAAERSRSVKDENGMELIITCETPTSFVSEEFKINLTLELSKQPDNVVKLFRIEMNLRLLVNGTELRAEKTVSFANVNLTTPRKKTTTIFYRNSWGKAKLQLQLQFFVDKVALLPSLPMETEWLNFLTMRSAGSFATNFDWLFILLGAVTLMMIGLVMYKRFL